MIVGKIVNTYFSQANIMPNYVQGKAKCEENFFLSNANIINIYVLGRLII